MKQTYKSPRKYDDFNEQIYRSDDEQSRTPAWVSGATWGVVDENNVPDTTPTVMGEDSTSPCYQATITCAQARTNDRFAVDTYTQSACPSPLWVYVKQGQVIIQTASQPSDTVRIIGYLMHE